MSHLADLILRGHLAEARTLAEHNVDARSTPSDASDSVFPADVALRCGHLALVAQLLRLGSPMKLPPPSLPTLLRAYLKHLTESYISPSRPVEIASAVWDQVYEGSRIFFEDQAPQIAMLESEKKDMAWLIERGGVLDRASLSKFSDSPPKDPS
jgi:hypothetical protein